MRFLFEAKQVFNDLLAAKSYLESQNNIKYIDLNQKDRIDFIYDVIDLMQNKNILKSNSGAVIKAIEDSKFGEKNDAIIRYLNDLKNIKIKDNTISLVTQLIMNNSLSYDKSKNWLNNESLYDRPSGDTDYVIKILTLASNPELQKDYFNEPLKVDDFIENGQIFDIAKIKDILDNKQTKNVDIKTSSKEAQTKARQEIKQFAKENNADENNVDSALDNANEKIKSELVMVLQSLGIKNPMPWIEQNFEEGQTIEYLTTKILRNYR